MNVAVMYSGGKDSTYAIDLCLRKGWNIKYLLSVKPTRTDCYLFHFATVEITKELSKILGLKHIFVACDVADPLKEAQIVKEIISKNPVDAVILGGVGLQETQIKSIRDALFDLGVEVFASHTSYDHTKLLNEMIDNGYKIIITQVAADGFTKDWLGMEINKENFSKLKKLSEKYGFHLGAEGGHWDSLVIGGPIFDKKIEILKSSKMMETECSGYLKIEQIKLVNKNLILSI